jgi:solute carrier family 27 fatty acid transporter 1/4
VSTNEVEGIVSRVLELTDMATSYGVEIPDNEGRAGMVAIPVSGDIEIDLEKLHAGCVDQLPKYARPIFVRLVKEVQMTSKSLHFAFSITRCIARLFCFSHIQAPKA